MEQVSLHVAGMWCSNCARAVEKGLKIRPGIHSAQVNFAAKSAVISFDPDEQSPESVAEAIGSIGYSTAPQNLDGAALQEMDRKVLREQQIRFVLGLIPGMWVMGLQWSGYIADLPATSTRWTAIASGILASFVLFVSGWKILLAGWRTLRVGVPGMDSLVSLGALGAWGLSWATLWNGGSETWFDTASFLILAVSAGRLLEHAVRQRGLDAVRQLLALSPPIALRVGPDGQMQEVPIAALKTGDRIRILPGEASPIDGRILQGRSTLDRSLLDGEPLPTPVGPQDPIEAGCTNLHGALLVEVTAGLGRRRLDHIASQVQEAMAHQHPTPSLAQRFSERLAPAVMVLSVMTAIVLWATGTPTDQAAVRAITVLIITCPCALGLAVPIAMAVAVQRAARSGILFRSAEALERAATVDTVIFDKTGTLTTGQPKVVAVHPVGNATESEILEWAQNTSIWSPHPLAKAIRAHTMDPSGLENAPSGDHQEEPGRGIRWTQENGDVVLLGAQKWLCNQGVDASQAPHSIHTQSGLSFNGVLQGWIEFQDSLREETPMLLEALHQEGIETWVLSGDKDPVVQALVKDLGIQNARGDCSPLDKAQQVQALQASGRKLAFVGDGFNDAPALGYAHLGIAVESATSATHGAAKISLQAPGIGRVAFLLKLAGQTHKIMRQNLGWALAYNVCAIPLAVSGNLTPATAASAMIVSSITVSLNSFRLSRIDSNDLEGKTK